ncbi:MAG: M23 family metallopeptidase [Bacteroidales bacterium]|nr:M23 family metallopeptidase [Bacteroidales bacterium]
MRTANRILLPAVLLLAAACGKEAGPDTDGPDAVRDRRIPAAQVALYGNLSSYNLLPDNAGTRTEGRSVTLGSLLDTDHARTVRFGDITFTQIPFLPDGEPALAEYGADPAPDIGAATAIRKFYVETLQEGVRHRFVAAMVAEASYAASHPDFDYLDMPGFTGAVLLSSPEGVIFRVENYQAGLLRESVLLPKEEIAGKNGLRYLKLYRPASDTRAGESTDGWELKSAVCMAEIPETDRAEKSAILISHPQYTISITTNLPDYVDVKGCGTYSSGSWATLGGFPRHTFYSLDFGRWTGDFAGEKRPYFPWKVTHDLFATVWYEDRGPCVDLERGVANPLKRMSIAATGSGSYVNGTYKALRGYYEDETPRYHWGIDLDAKPGTPVYSMYSGYVIRTESNHPDRYEEKSFGNVIVTENEVKGYDRKVYLQYSHLRYGIPIAVNPRTGKPFAKGDRVFAGDLIGYTGKTGNAFNDIDVPNKHLDLMAAFAVDPSTGKLKSDALTDPAPFLNGTLDLKNLQRKKGQVDNIRCD